MPIPPTSQARFSWVGIALSMLLFPTAGQQIPALAAERIYASYSPLERSISVAALETYAKTGKITVQSSTIPWMCRYCKECRALELPRTQYNLRDARVLAAIAINPITSSLFGSTQLSQIQSQSPLNLSLVQFLPAKKASTGVGVRTEFSSVITITNASLFCCGWDCWWVYRLNYEHRLVLVFHFQVSLQVQIPG